MAFIALAAAALWLTQADLRPFIEREASAVLGRKVSIGDVQIAWGSPLGVELRNLTIANAPWGSEAEMVRLGHLSALVDLGSLFRGRLRYERLRLTDLKVVLERDKGGTGNWKFAGSGGGLGLVPRNRSQFPVLIDFVGERGLVTYRTRSGQALRIDLDRVAIRSPDAYSPVILQAVGAYNDVAARLDATTDPYFILHDAATPFGTRFALLGNDTDIGFEGTMMEPLDFEGVRGDLSLTARKMDDVLAVMGAERKVDLPLLIVGRLSRDRDYWSLSDARGRLLRASFNGRLELLEGRPVASRTAPDDLALDLNFALVDAAPILAAFGGGGGGTALSDMPLRPQGLSDIDLTLTLSADRLMLAGMQLPAFSLDGRLEGGEVNLRDLKFIFGGGTLAFDGSLRGDGTEGDLRLNAHLIRAQAGEIATMLGGKNEVRGQLNGSARLRLRGATLGEGLKGSSGTALLTLAQGDIAHSLVEQVSADLRSLFRTRQGRVPVTCLLAAMTVENGIGTLSPLRLESDAAILLGGGTVDLVGRRLDLTLQTEGDSTSIFALDIPIRVSGPLDDLAAGPSGKPDHGLIVAAEHADVPEALPKGLRDMARASACAR